MTSALPRVIILASGNGSNAQVLLDSAAHADATFEVVAVISNHADAHVLRRAAEAGVRTEVLERQMGEARERYDSRLARILYRYEAELIVLAGWMRILSQDFCVEFSIINLHPALPGAFPGATAIADAFDAFAAGDVTETGVMVHWVPDAGVDTGPTIISESVPILATDTLDSLTARVHAVEHRLLPVAVETALRSVLSPTTCF